MASILNLRAIPKHEKRSQQKKAEGIEEVHSVDQKRLLQGGMHYLQTDKVQIVGIGYKHQAIDRSVQQNNQIAEWHVLYAYLFPEILGSAFPTLDSLRNADVELSESSSQTNTDQDNEQIYEVPRECHGDDYVLRTEGDEKV